MNRTAIPWILTVILALYVLGLEYVAKNGKAFDPSFQFYDTAQVRIWVHEPPREMDMDFFGEYNNVLEGERQTVRAQPTGESYLLSFRMNSPRHAYLFANDEKLEIFLIPGDTSLRVHLHWGHHQDLLDSVHYEGKTAAICEYYNQKAMEFEEVNLLTARHTLANSDYQGFEASLDSAVARELLFLAEKEVAGELPNWFAVFEKNEILYHRAYLKLTNAKSLQGAPEQQPPLQISNPRAVFSYYYYLYLQAYFSTLVPDKASPRAAADLKQELELACTLLEGEVRDVYLSRAIFKQLQEAGPEEAKRQLQVYREFFSSQRYVRFLEMSIGAGRQGD